MFALLGLVLATIVAPSPSAQPTVAPATAQWLKSLFATSYTSRSGASISLASVLQGDPYRDAQAAAAEAPSISFDEARGLVRVDLGGRNRGLTLVVRAKDVPAPPAAVRAKIDGGPIGLTYAALLAKFHADPNLASKNIETGQGGAVVLVTAMDEDPPPSRYDHGYQSYLFQEYVVRDGVVVAYAWRHAEN